MDDTTLGLVVCLTPVIVVTLVFTTVLFVAIKRANSPGLQTRDSIFLTDLSGRFRIVDDTTVTFTWLGLRNVLQNGTLWAFPTILAGMAATVLWRLSNGVAPDKIDVGTVGIWVAVVTALVFIRLRVRAHGTEITIDAARREMTVKENQVVRSIPFDEIHRFISLAIYSPGGEDSGPSATVEISAHVSTGERAIVLGHVGGNPGLAARRADFIISHLETLTGIKGSQKSAVEALEEQVKQQEMMLAAQRSELSPAGRRALSAAVGLAVLLVIGVVFLRSFLSPGLSASAPAAEEGPTATMAAVDLEALQPVYLTDYHETGAGTHNWDVTIPSDSVLIVSGVEVNGTGGGVFQAYSGDQRVSLSVSRGFYMIVPREHGELEWCRLLRKAEALSWARATQIPLEGWACE